MFLLNTHGPVRKTRWPLDLLSTTAMTQVAEIDKLTPLCVASLLSLHNAVRSGGTG